MDMQLYTTVISPAREAVTKDVITLTMSKREARAIADVIARTPCGLGGMDSPVYRLHKAFESVLK